MAIITDLAERSRRIVTVTTDEVGGATKCIDKLCERRPKRLARVKIPANGDQTFVFESRYFHKHWKVGKIPILELPADKVELVKATHPKDTISFYLLVKDAVPHQLVTSFDVCLVSTKTDFLELEARLLLNVEGFIQGSSELHQ